MDGAELITAERRRQVDAEGWTPEHDDEHDEFEMMRAACCYAAEAGFPRRPLGVIHPNWPWATKWWKPSEDPIRNLVKAGALIAAEIDRLQRKAGK